MIDSNPMLATTASLREVLDALDRTGQSEQQRATAVLYVMRAFRLIASQRGEARG